MRIEIAVAFLLAAAVTPALAQDVLVVAPKEFVPSLAAWKAHRERHGRSVAVRELPGDVGAAVREQYEKSGKKLRFVLLVGDVEQVPCAVVPRRATGQPATLDPDPKIATDAPYADLDGDGVPDLALGRIPADTPQEAKSYLDRVVAYETSADFGPWRGKLNLVAGTGGYGPMVDMMLEGLTRQLLAKLVPASVDVSVTYANPLSPFCPPPAEFADVAVRRWSEGALVVSYVGHGAMCNVDSVHVGKEHYPIFGMDQVKRVASEHGAPLSIFVACSTGHFDGTPDCLAEELLKRPAGPVAVIASSRVSSPYSNGIVAKEMLTQLYDLSVPTAGELLLRVRQDLVRPGNDPTRAQIERLGELYEKDAAVRAVDRADHVALYNLLGDPCLAIARPAPMTLEAAGPVMPGAKLSVRGATPVAGTATVTLEKRRDAPFRPPVAPKRTAEDYRCVYEAANARELARVEVPVKPGAFAAEIAVPADVPPGRYVARVFLTGHNGAAAGACDVTVEAVEAK